MDKLNDALKDTATTLVDSNAEEPQEGDVIGDDGLLHCGKCGQPKQMRLETSLRSTPLIVPIMCECEKQAEKEREEREARRAAKERADRMRSECFKGCPKLLGCTFETDDHQNPLVSRACLRYAETFDLKDCYGLLFWGDVGTGKSFMSAAIANRVIDLGFSALQTDMGSIVTSRESSFENRQKNIDRLMSYDLLLIDDLGAQRSTEYMMEQVYAIIDGRYRASKPMVITTNMDADKIAENRDFGPWSRVLDRILEVCYPLEFKGKSRRRANAFDMRDTMRKRLGL